MEFAPINVAVSFISNLLMWFAFPRFFSCFFLLTENKINVQIGFLYTVLLKVIMVHVLSLEMVHGRVK